MAYSLKVFQSFLRSKNGLTTVQKNNLKVFKNIAVFHHNFCTQDNAKERDEGKEVLGEGANKSAEKCDAEGMATQSLEATTSSSDSAAGNGTTEPQSLFSRLFKGPDSLRKQNIEKYISETIELKQQLSQLNDKYMRALAEVENTRNRMSKQLEESKFFAIQSFCKDLLEVSDILSQACKSISKEQIESKEDDAQFKSLYDGLILTEKQLHKVFAKNNLNKIEPNEGEKFDPFYHEAIFQVPSTDSKVTGTVSIMTKVGYKLKERTIRPAFVGVFSMPQEKTDQP